MVHILHVSVLFALGSSAIQTTGSGNRASKSKPVTKFQLSLMEIEKLQFLRSGLNEFIATCLPKETYKLTRATKGVYRMNRSVVKKRWTKSTKITTTIKYMRKRAYPLFSSRRKVIYWHLVKMFSGNDEEKKKLLIREDVDITSDRYCYMEVFTYWRRHCFYTYYETGGGVKDIQKLLEQACSADWLNTTKIIRGLRSCCQRTSTTEVNMSTPASPLESSSKRSYTMVKKFRLVKDEIIRMKNLRSDIAELVATFSTRETFKTTPPNAHWMTKKLIRRISRVSYPFRKTKLTTKGNYIPKRTYPTHKERRLMMFKHFISIFTGNDKEKEAFLVNTEKPPTKSTVCYMEVYSCFTQNCFYDHYWKFIGLKLMQDLLARACAAKWLTTRQIMQVLKSCCEKRFKYKAMRLT